MRDPKEMADASPCVRFARDFLPELNKALSEVYSDTTSGDANAKPVAATTSAESKSETAKLETATTEAASAEKKAAGSESTVEKEPVGVYQTGTPEQRLPALPAESAK